MSAGRDDDFEAARAEGVVLGEEELSTVQTALMLVLAPIEIIDHRFMHEHGLITETEVYAVHPTSRLGKRIEALQARLTALRANLEAPHNSVSLRNPHHRRTNPYCISRSTTLYCELLDSQLGGANENHRP